MKVLQSFPLTLNASLAQLVARRSHNPKVVSSILTGGMAFFHTSANQVKKA